MRKLARTKNSDFDKNSITHQEEKKANGYKKHLRKKAQNPATEMRQMEMNTNEQHKKNGYWSTETTFKQRPHLWQFNFHTAISDTATIEISKGSNTISSFDIQKVDSISLLTVLISILLR